MVDSLKFFFGGNETKKLLAENPDLTIESLIEPVNGAKGVLYRIAGTPCAILRTKDGLMRMPSFFMKHPELL